MGFTKMATCSPKVVSNAQLVNMFFEAGTVDAKTCTVSEILNAMMVRGYMQIHPKKKDSFGAQEVLQVGVGECQRWGTLFLTGRLNAAEQRGHLFPQPAPSDLERISRRLVQECKAKCCQCGNNGPAKACVLAQ